MSGKKDPKEVRSEVFAEQESKASRQSITQAMLRNVAMTYARLHDSRGRAQEAGRLEGLDIGDVNETRTNDYGYLARHCAFISYRYMPHLACRVSLVTSSFASEGTDASEMHDGCAHLYACMSTPFLPQLQLRSENL